MAPYDADPNRQKSGFAFSDISYAVDMDKGVSQEDLVIVRILPTIRLYENACKYMDGVIMEIKPQSIEQEVGTEVYWSTTKVYQFSVRYLTLKGMTMLQEYLKLYYMSSKDPNFFPETEHLNIHLGVAVGHTVWHYIHTVGNGAIGEPIEYVSYCLGTFNMKETSGRNQIREMLNQIMVLQVTVFKESLQNKVREVLALGPAEIRRRLESRAHEGVRFLHSVTKDGVRGFSVEHTPPTHETKSSSKPCPSFRTNPEILETELERGSRIPDHLHLPSASSSYAGATASTTNKARRRKDDKVGAVAAFASQASTFEEHTKDGKKRCQAPNRSLKQCGNAALPGQKTCSTHTESMKRSQPNNTPVPCCVPLSPSRRSCNRQ